MNIQITSRHDTKLSQDYQDFIRGELEALEKFSDKISSCHVVVDSEKTSNVVEIALHTLGHDVIAKGTGDNVGKALDEALDKIKRQIKDINDKMKSHH